MMTEFRYKFLKNKMAIVGSIMLIIIFIIAFLMPIFISPGLEEISSNLLRPPSLDHYFGTDELGRDLFARVIQSGKITLSIAAIIVFIAAALGIVWGSLAVYTEGIVAILLNRAMDVLQSFPGIITALFAIAIFGTGIVPLVLAISLAYAPRFARVIAGATQPILKEEFILAEKALGANHFRILAIHVLPNLISQITVLVTIYMPYIIIIEATLSFLGLGAPPDIPTWGRLISNGLAFMQTASWLTVFPGIAIILTSIAFNLLGDGIRDILDPRSTRRLE